MNTATDHRPVAGTGRDKLRRIIVRCSCGQAFAVERVADLRDAYARRAAHVSTAAA